MNHENFKRALEVTLAGGGGGGGGGFRERGGADKILMKDTTPYSVE